MALFYTRTVKTHFNFYFVFLDKELRGVEMLWRLTGAQFRPSCYRG
jgi:hypothetical protein